jgi:hypothetical protein
MRRNGRNYRLTISGFRKMPGLNGKNRSVRLNIAGAEITKKLAD